MIETQYGRKNYIDDQIAKQQQRELDNKEGADDREQNDQQFREFCEEQQK